MKKLITINLSAIFIVFVLIGFGSCIGPFGPNPSTIYTTLRDQLRYDSTSILSLYLSGKPISENKYGLRKVTGIVNPDAVSETRMIFIGDKWHNLISGNEKESVKLKKVFNSFDTTQYAIDKNQRTTTFDNKLLQSTFENYQTASCTLIIYEKGFLSFYNQGYQILEIMPMPDKIYPEIRKIVSNINR